MPKPAANSSATALPRRRKRQPNSILRWVARRLELRSVGLVPEHFNHVEGLRAALAVGLPLALAVFAGEPGLGWAVFAAFWTCLCDAPGPHRLRRRLLAIFVIGGALIAVAGSWAASFSPLAGMLVGPIFVFAAVLGSSRIAFGGLLGTLLGVVAVVAVGFPQPLAQACVQAVAFLGGAIWAYLLINLLWPIDAILPLRRATDAVVIRLHDMADSLVLLGEGRHRDDRWHSEHSEHRRAVRLAIERLRGCLDRYQDEGPAIVPFIQARNTAEAIFGALIALDQAFIEQVGPTHERLAAARAFRTTLIAWRLTSAAAPHSDRSIDWAANRLLRLAGRLQDNLFAGCLLALRNAILGLSQNAPEDRLSKIATKPARGISQAALRQALRQSAGLVAVYYTALVCHLGYPYWAAMAVIVVLQGGARVTWARCLERILGSLVGGLIALALFLVVDATLPLAALAIVLAGTAIALRAVNYTVFVIFLTMLFVIVTEMLHPGLGIASARMLDNVIGSVAALLAVFLLWPDFGASLEQRLEEGIAANRAYFDAVQLAKPVPEIENARRAAGLASIEAEIALYDVSGLLRRLRLPAPHLMALSKLRNTAGRAAMAWHRRLAQSPIL